MTAFAVLGWGGSGADLRILAVRADGTEVGRGQLTLGHASVPVVGVSERAVAAVQHPVSFVWNRMPTPADEEISVVVQLSAWAGGSALFATAARARASAVVQSIYLQATG